MNTVQQSAQVASARVLIHARPAWVHAFACGSVTVKRCHHTGLLPESAPTALRFAAILADPRFAPAMPIWCFVIEHPDALVVIDAGGHPEYADPSTWTGHQTTRRLLHSFLKVRVNKGHALPERMRAAGLAPEDVHSVVLTHQHIDHTGSVPSFVHADLWTTRAEDESARAIGAEHWRWRHVGQPVRYADQEGHPGQLGTTVDLLGDGSIAVIHTPGHTPGSLTVSLTTDTDVIWFTGDTSFTAQAMDPAAPTAGIHSNIRDVRRLQAELSGRGPLFPSHDPDVATRLRALGTAVGES